MRFRSGSVVNLGGLLLLCLFSASLLATWPSRLRYPGEQNYVEGMRLVEMVHLGQGIPIYSHSSPNRFDAAIYGPLYYLLGARLIDPDQPAYFPLRALSALAMIGCAGLLSLFTFWVSRRILAAVLAPLVFLSFAILTRYGTSARSDMAALVLVFAGFLLAYKYFRHRMLFLAVPPMILGLFFKQQYVSAPLAVILALMLERRYRVAVQFATSLGAGGAFVLTFFQFVVFPGQAFLSHFFLYNAVEFTWEQFKSVGLFWPAMILFAPLVLAWDYLRGNPNRLVGCYFGVTVAVSLATAGKTGSDLNYWFEMLIVTSALAAAWAAERVYKPANLPAPLLVLALSLLAGRVLTRPGPQPKDFQTDREIQEYLHRSFPPGTLALGHYAGDLIRAGLRLPISDFDHYAFMVAAGRIPETELPDQIGRRRFGVIILNFRSDAAARLCGYLNTELWMKAILANYQLAAEMDVPAPEMMCKYDRFYVWVPRRNSAPSQKPPP